jgi:hypothetical protein
MGKKVNFVLTPDNEAMLTSYKSYAPKGFVPNLSKLLNDLLNEYLQRRLHEWEQTSNQD